MALKLRSLVLLTCCLATTTLAKKATAPPTFVKQPAKEIAYKIAERVELECKAGGDPKPSYKWRKDGKPLDMADPSVKLALGSGNLIIETPDERNEGEYQCLASNGFGTAVSTKALLRKAFLQPFPSITNPEIHRPNVGVPLVLKCDPPPRYPSGVVYWELSPQYEGQRPEQLLPTNRMSEDFNGNLYFANIEETDSRDGRTYVCTASNNVLRSLVKGDDQKIQPQRIGTPSFLLPMLSWSSWKRGEPEIAVAGKIKRMKCIFSGFPTPRVTWSRVDGRPVPDDVVTDLSFGQEIYFKKVTTDHEGDYRCSAENFKEGNTGAPVTADVKLLVESAPEWVTQIQNINRSEEQDVEFVCKAKGKPAPRISWSINGKPLSELKPDPRRTVMAGRILYKNLTKTDAQVLQCNASNKHGYIFENAYLHVRAEPPSFLKPPVDLTVAVGQEVNITCEIDGAPKPTVMWKKDKTKISGARFRTFAEGKYLYTLNFKGVVKADEGMYECHAHNKFGDINEAAKLEVREKTQITTPPKSKTVTAPQEVIFRCQAKTDPREMDKLKVYWLRDGKKIDYLAEKHITMNTNDNSLKISPTSADDSSEYTCVADNGIDQDRFTAELHVKDRPDPPTDVQIRACSTQKATLSWKPGSENNDEVQEFIVEYNTTFDAEGTYHFAANTTRGTHTANVPLSPWVNYTFSVIARNKIGKSDRSSFSVICKTDADRPYKNPDGVCTESRKPSELVIVWKPMPKVDHNGEGFQYEVYYRRRVSTAKESRIAITDATIGELVVPNQETFKEYEIYVRAKNKIGFSPEKLLVKRVGYSGADTPTEAPTGFALLNDTLNATSAKFEWNAASEDPETVRGHFLGYVIIFWKTDDPDNKRKSEVRLKIYQPCPVLKDDSKRRKRAVRESGHAMNLWPFSSITATVAVLNNKHSGAPSNSIQFNTPEGYPGMAGSFNVFERGSHHLAVSWVAPIEPNGIIVSYTVGYHPSSGSSPMKTIVVSNPLARQTKIKDLTPETDYRLYLWAHTSAGQGKVAIAEGRTQVSSPPDEPLFEVKPGEDFINVSWTPSNKEQPKNPGLEFYVEYRKEGSNEPWNKSRIVSDQNWANVTGLETGGRYEVRVVAVNGEGEETKTPIKTVQVGRRVSFSPATVTTATESVPVRAFVAPVGPDPGPSKQSVATAGWFIGMMCAIAFLLLILIIICLIKRNRGGKYPVHEKEKLRGKDPDKDDDPEFGEYTRTDEPDYKKSQGSLESEEKPLESDTDSMAEYDETDPSKFNEDGSFIGQYGGKKKEGKAQEPDSTSPSALSTFV